MQLHGDWVTIWFSLHDYFRASYLANQQPLISQWMLDDQYVDNQMRQWVPLSDVTSDTKYCKIIEILHDLINILMSGCNLTRFRPALMCSLRTQKVKVAQKKKISNNHFHFFEYRDHKLKWLHIKGLFENQKKKYFANQWLREFHNLP